MARLLFLLFFVGTVSAQQTIVVPSSGNLQAALDSARYGDTVALAPAGIYDSPVPFQFRDKGPCAVGQQITLTVSDLTAIPAKLLAYAPGNHPVITAADAARMPKLRTTSSLPIVNFARGSKCWRLKGIEITNVDKGVQVPRLISGDLEQAITAYSELPDRLVFEYIYAHPAEETGAPLSAANIARTAENTMSLSATNVRMYAVVFQGFAGRFKYGDPQAGQVMTSSNIMVDLGENWIVENSLLQAWTYAFFPGGSGIPSWAVTEKATVVSCTGNPATSCTLSNVTGLEVGDPISVYVSTSTSQNKWGAAFVKSISGNTVTFVKPLCQSFDGSNSCTDQNGTPANGDRAQWGGHQPKNFLFQRSTFDHPPEWRTLLGECGGKGYAEHKSIINLTYNGVTFRGCSGFTNTVRNQDGDFPWASLDGLTITNNYFPNSNNIFVMYGQDVIPTRRTKGITWSNNLATGVELNPQVFAGMLAGNFSNADDVSITHNTVVWSPVHVNFTNFGSMGRLKIQDNIFPMGQNACFRGDSTTPMINCWPDAMISNNVLVNPGERHYEQEWWLGSWPNQIVLRDWNALGFVRVDPANLDARNDYRLRDDSPLKGKASDGTDPGVNWTQLIANLGYDPNGGTGPIPTPTPTPVPSPTPSPTPTPTPTPTVSFMRVAISSDGNEHDCDDITATAMSVALLAKTGNASRLVYYGYADHHWSTDTAGPEDCAGTNRIQKMRDSSYGTAELWGGFDLNVFRDVSADLPGAVTALTAQINASSASNPLTIIGAGPMDVIGRALNAAGTNRQYATVISHSEWNDNHSDSPCCNEAMSHTGWTWTKMQSAFPTVTFTHLTDQNPGTKTNPDRYFWLRDSGDAKLRWLWSRHLASMTGNSGNFDPSDAGMVYWLLTGDQSATPEKFRTMLEVVPGPTPTPVPSPVPTPTPAPGTSPDNTKAVTITDASGAVWTLGSSGQTLRNGVHTGGGVGLIYKWSGGEVYVEGDDRNWYRWTVDGWAVQGATEPGGPTPEPTPTPTPTPSPSPTPLPTPSPTPSPTPLPTPTPSPTPTPCGTTSWPSSIKAQNAKLDEQRALGCYPVRRFSGGMEYARPPE